MRRSGQSLLRSSISAFALLALLAPAAMADPVSLRAGERGEGIRMVFEWPEAVSHSARLSGNQLKLTFARPAETDIASLSVRLSGWVSGASRSADGREINITLTRPARVQSFASGSRVIVDLTPSAASAAASPPPAAPAVEATPVIREAEVRTGRHQGFNRAVLRLAARPVISREGNTLTLTAPAARRLSDRQLQQLRLPQVENVQQTINGDRLTLAFTLKPGVRTNNFRSPSGIGIDFNDAPAPARTAQVETPPPAPVAAPAREPVATAPVASVAAPEVPVPAEPAPVTPAPVTPPAAAVTQTAPAAPAPVNPAPAAPVATAAPSADEEEALTSVTASIPAEEAVPAPVQQQSDGLFPIEMAVGKDAPLAVFQRGESLFVVVTDKNTPRELIPLVGSAMAASSRVELLPAQGGRVIRINLGDKKVFPTITAAPAGWKITFGDAAVATSPLTVREEPDYSLGPRLFAAARNPASPVLFADPVVGDTLAIIPVPAAASGVVNRIRTVQAELLPSYQGIVIKSWAEDLNVISNADGVEISSVSGFKLAERLPGEFDPQAATSTSATPQQPATSGINTTDTSFLPPLLDFAAMGRPVAGKFTEGRERLQNAILRASDHEKQRAWLDLANHYFIYGMPTEAASIWQDIAKNNSDLASRPEFALLRAIAGFSSGTPNNIKAALTALNQPSTDSSLWHGMLAAQEGDWVAASERFRPVLNRIWDYPEPYLSRLAVAAIDTSLQTQDYQQAEMLLGKLNDRYRMESRKPTPAVEYLTGALNWGRNRGDQARASLGSAAQSWDQRWRARAELMLIDADIKDNRTRPAELTQRLERLRFAWRGDALEFDILHRLAKQHIASGDFAAAFEDYAQMVTKYPALATKANIADEQKAAFIRIFQGDDRDRTPAYSQLAIWDRYPEFRPTQPSVLSDVNLYLADRVAGMDLIDRAAGFYNDVLKTTTDPVPRANLGTRIAGLYLLDHKYNEAIKTLDDTEPVNVANQPSVLREDAKDERRQLRARAIVGLGKPDDALSLLVNDYSEPATRLRADINWKTRRWAEAAATLDALIGDAGANGQKLTDEKSSLILNRATALALSGDRTALRDLRIKYGELMAATVDGPTFQLLTRPEVAGGLPDRATLNGRVAEVDLFQKFLERYRSPNVAAPESTSSVAGTRGN